MTRGSLGAAGPRHAAGRLLGRRPVDEDGTTRQAGREQQPTRCVGTLGAETVQGDLEVPRGRTCRLLGTAVDGRVQVGLGSTLHARSAVFGEGIGAHGFRRVVIEGGKVAGRGSTSSSRRRDPTRTTTSSTAAAASASRTATAVGTTTWSTTTVRSCCAACTWTPAASTAPATTGSRTSATSRPSHPGSSTASAPGCATSATATSEPRAGYSPRSGVRLEPPRLQPAAGRRPRGAGQPRVVDGLGELVAGQPPDVGAAEQHRGVPVEVRRGEERRRLVEHQRLLGLVGLDPEDDDVVVPLARSPGRRRRGAGCGRTRSCVPTPGRRPCRPATRFAPGIDDASSWTSATVARRLMRPSVGRRLRGRLHRRSALASPHGSAGRTGGQGSGGARLGGGARAGRRPDRGDGAVPARRAGRGAALPPGRRRGAARVPAAARRGQGAGGRPGPVPDPGPPDRAQLRGRPRRTAAAGQPAQHLPGDPDRPRRRAARRTATSPRGPSRA